MKLLEMSICAGVLVFAVTLLRAAGLSRLPKRMFVLLWTIVLVRLLVPVNLPIKSGIAVPAVRLLNKAACWAGMRLHGGSAGDTSAYVPEAASSGIGGTGNGAWINWFSNFTSVFYIVWIAGAAAFGCYFIYRFLREYRLLEQALPLETSAGLQGASGLSDSKEAHLWKMFDTEETRLRTMSDTEEVRLRKIYDSACRIAGIRRRSGKKDRLLVHDRLASPLVWGLFRQRTVFPKQMLSMQTPQMEYILVHEMVHIRRRDNFWKVLSAAAVCIHWFNPMAWVMYLLLDRDLELSCDERVVALYGSQSRQDYAMTILDFARNQKETVVFSSGFGKNPTKERIVAVMKYKRLTSAGILCAAVLLAGAGTVFAAEDSPQAPQGETVTKVEAAQNPSDTEDIKDQTWIAGSDEEDDTVVYAVDAEGSPSTVSVSFADGVDFDKYEVEKSAYITDESGKTKAIKLKVGKNTAKIDGKEYELYVNSEPEERSASKTKARAKAE